MNHIVACPVTGMSWDVLNNSSPFVFPMSYSSYSIVTGIWYNLGRHLRHHLYDYAQFLYYDIPWLIHKLKVLGRGL